MEKKESIASFKAIDIVQVSLMAAMTYVATAFFNVPIGTGAGKAVLHLGDSMVFISAVMLGRKKGALSSAVGMCLFDLLSPYAVWAPFTFVIKGTMAYIAARLAFRNDYEGKSIWNNIFAFGVAGVFMIAAYFLSGVILNLILIKATFVQAIVLSAGEIPGNIIQVAGGMAIAVPLLKFLTNTNVIKNRG